MRLIIAMFSLTMSISLFAIEQTLVSIDKHLDEISAHTIGQCA